MVTAQSRKCKTEYVSTETPSPEGSGKLPGGEDIWLCREKAKDRQHQQRKCEVPLVPPDGNIQFILVHTRQSSHWEAAVERWWVKPGYVGLLSRAGVQ